MKDYKKSCSIVQTATIIMYRWEGKKFGIEIKSECKECEMNTAILASMKQKEFTNKPVVIEIKPWLSNLWEALRHGGWHAPVILVNGKLFSQGVVVNRDKLSQSVLQIVQS